MNNEVPVPLRGAIRPCRPRLLFADIFFCAVNTRPFYRRFAGLPVMQTGRNSQNFILKKKAGSMILPCLCNTCRLFTDPDMFCQRLKLQESAYGTDIPLLKLWKLLKFLQSGEKCTAIHGFSLHLCWLSANPETVSYASGCIVERVSI